MEDRNKRDTSFSDLFSPSVSVEKTKKRGDYTPVVVREGRRVRRKKKEEYCI